MIFLYEMFKITKCRNEKNNESGVEMIIRIIRKNYNQNCMAI